MKFLRCASNLVSAVSIPTKYERPRCAKHLRTNSVEADASVEARRLTAQNQNERTSHRNAGCERRPPKGGVDASNRRPICPCALGCREGDAESIAGSFRAR